jgi:hypothetical protein
VERLLLTAEETAEILSIGRTKVYELCDSGCLSRSRFTAVDASPQRPCTATSIAFAGMSSHEYHAEEQTVVCRR